VEELEILHLPRATRNYRFDELTVQRLNKLANRLGSKTETEIVSVGIAHLLGSIERDQAVWMTAPSEATRAHKRSRDAA
jgi:hypothetical protein